MSLIIQYCEGCGERIPSPALESGEALLFENSYYYGPCKERLLAEHPELAGLGAGPARAPSARASSVLEAPLAPDTRRRGRASSSSVRMRRPSGANLPAVGQTGANRRSETSRRIQKSSGPSSDPTKMIVWLGGLVAVAAVVAMLFLNRPPADTPAPVTPHATGGPTPVPPRDTKADKVAELERKATTSDRYAEIIDAIELLEEELAGTPHLAKLAELRSTVLQRQSVAAAQAFQLIKAASDRLVAAKKFHEARVKWEGFSVQLLSSDWRDRIDQERRAIEAAEQTAEEQPPPAPRLADRIPTGGEHLGLLLPNVVRWRQNGQGWEREANAPEMKAATGTDGALLWCLKGGATAFVDHYFTFEYIVTAGQLVAVVRLPEERGQSCQIPLPATETWRQVHVVVRGPQVAVWIDEDESSLREFTPQEAFGAVGLFAGPNTNARVRRLELRVQTYGKDFALPAEKVPPAPAPQPDKQQVLFNGRNLDGWVGTDARWSASDGVLVVAEGAAPTYIRTGQPSWSRYTLRFEVRRLTGNLDIRYHCSDTQTQLKFGIASAKTLGVAPDEWLSLTVVVEPTVAYGYLFRNATPAGTVRANFAATSGQVGFFLEPQVSAEFRHIVIERAD